MKHVICLWGGVYSFDGIVTSAGIAILQRQLAQLPGTEVTGYAWASWPQVADRIRGLPDQERVVIVGYSGGGWRATSIANDLLAKGGGHTLIDLMILLDPSPSWWMNDPSCWIHANVKRAICFQNGQKFFGLGAGVLHNMPSRLAPIEVVPINMNHLAVQFDAAIRKRVVSEVAAL